MKDNSVMDLEFKPNQKDVEVQCTDKCHSALSNKGELSGRERQLCVLLTRNDELSKKVFNKLSDKVDLDSLSNNGYLNLGSNQRYKAVKTSKKAKKSLAIRLGNNRHKISTFNKKSKSMLKNSLLPTKSSAQPKIIDSSGSVEQDIDPTLQFITGNH